MVRMRTICFPSSQSVFRQTNMLPWTTVLSIFTTCFLLINNNAPSPVAPISFSYFVCESPPTSFHLLLLRALFKLLFLILLYSSSTSTIEDIEQSHHSLPTASRSAAFFSKDQGRLKKKVGRTVLLAPFHTSFDFWTAAAFAKRARRHTNNELNHSTTSAHTPTNTAPLYPNSYILPPTQIHSIIQGRVCIFSDESLHSRTPPTSLRQGVVSWPSAFSLSYRTNSDNWRNSAVAKALLVDNADWNPFFVQHLVSAVCGRK